MSEELNQTTELNILDIMEMLPHRYPFLLVDKMTDVVPGKSATGFKNVTMNEPFFTGHFPNNPVMPGVLQMKVEHLQTMRNVHKFKGESFVGDKKVCEATFTAMIFDK